MNMTSILKWIVDILSKCSNIQHVSLPLKFTLFCINDTKCMSVFSASPEREFQASGSLHSRQLQCSCGLSVWAWASPDRMLSGSICVPKYDGSIWSFASDQSVCDLVELLAAGVFVSKPFPSHEVHSRWLAFPHSTDAQCHDEALGI